MTYLPYSITNQLCRGGNGIYGGCWCISYHPECGQRHLNYRDVKRERVSTGRAHAALVVDSSGRAQGWCQFGSPDELSNIKHKRAYDKDPPPVPDWRITCIFVDKGHRGRGISRLALDGALHEIVRAGGGLVEAISEVTVGRAAQGRFLFSATVELLEEFGFQRVRQVGKHAWIVSREVEPITGDDGRR